MAINQLRSFLNNSGINPVLGIRKERTGAGALLRAFCRTVDILTATPYSEAAIRSIVAITEEGSLWESWREQRSHARKSESIMGRKMVAEDGGDQLNLS